MPSRPTSSASAASTRSTSTSRRRPTGAIADYRDYVDALADALRALPDVTRVDTGLLDASRDWTYLTDRQLLLLDDAGFDEALARMAPERVPAQVARTRELLALPSPDVKAMAQRDPLGWFELDERAPAGRRGRAAARSRRRTDGYVTADGRAQLLVVHPTQPPFDTTYARALLADVAGADARVRATFAPQWADEGLAPPRMDVAGGHRTAIETESLMRGEAVEQHPLVDGRRAGAALPRVPQRLARAVRRAAHPARHAGHARPAPGGWRPALGRRDRRVGHALRPGRRRPRAAVCRLSRPPRARPRAHRRRARSSAASASACCLGAVTTAATFLGLWFMSFPEPAAARPRRRAGDAADGVLHADGARRGAARTGMGGAVARSVDARTRAVGRPPPTRDPRASRSRSRCRWPGGSRSCTSTRASSACVR